MYKFFISLICGGGKEFQTREQFMVTQVPRSGRWALVKTWPSCGQGGEELVAPSHHRCPQERKCSTSLCPEVLTKSPASGHQRAPVC